MTQAEITRHDSTAGRRFPAFLAAWALALALPACSQMPDWADPTDWFEGQEPPSKVAQTEENLKYMQTAGFPSVVSVPDVAPRVTALSARAKLLENLAADHSNAQYSGENLVDDTSTEAGTQRAAARPAQAPLVTAAGNSTPARGVSDAPPAPKIAQLLAAHTEPAPAPAAAQTPMPAPAPARTQIFQAEPAQAAPEPEPASTQIAQSAPAAQPRFQFPQFQGGAGAAQPGPAGRSQLAAIIYFRHGSAALDAQDREVLRDIASLQRLRGGKIRVVGHASAHTGTVTQVKHRLANFEISLKRANAVVAMLISLGVAREAVQGEAKGDAQTVYHEFMPTGERGKRRTEIFLEY